jgi:hypothetical protein
MTDTVVNNDQWSEIHSLDNQTDDIHYPPNWLRFDDTIEFPKVFVSLLLNSRIQGHGKCQGLLLLPIMKS